ncbi:MAG: helix-turn-helix domain-containing protein [Bacteroidota bacterium]
MAETITLSSINQIHEALGLPKPKHPLVSVVHAQEMHAKTGLRAIKIVMNLYQIVLKQGICGTLKYGRNSYDYQEGTLVFTAPGQILTYENTAEDQDNRHEGWTLLFHPDLIRKSSLADKIDDYTFFNYDVHEALHVSDEERITIEELLDKIVKEYSQNLDKHSQHLINANIQLLLDYCLRFYDRQFYTRTNLNTDVVSKFERLLKAYYKSDQVPVIGLPSVQHCAQKLHLSANYLSDLLKKETGKSAQEHIHLFIVEKAKNSLLNSSESISEIGYALGFEYPQHFSNLFKAKTGYSPRAYRSLGR